MSLNIQDRQIERVVLIDDNADVRKNYGYHVDDLNLQPFSIENPIRTLDDLLNNFTSDRDGAICDYHLNNSTYSVFNGDEIVKTLYLRKFPALLCSRDSDAPHSIRRLRQYIPNLVFSSDLSSEIIEKSFEISIAEFKGNFRSNRKPYQTLVRIENKDDFQKDCMKVSVVIPGWDTKRMIEIIIKKEETPIFDDIKTSLEYGQDYRAFATVNLGTESPDEIYIHEWRSLK